METSNIENIKFSLYLKSERLWWFSLAGWLLAVVVSVLSIFIEQKIALGFLGVISLLIPFFVIWLREIAGGYNFKADKCRRLILYSDGLGKAPSDAELLSVKGYSIGKKIDTAYYEAPYYDSTREPGPSRLLDILGESAFFTKELSKKVETSLTIILVSMMFVLVMLGLSSNFWVGFIEVTQESFIDFIEAFTIFIVALVAGDIYLLKTKYAKLAIEADKSFNAAFKLKNENEISLHTVISIISDYDACVQGCPPIPLFMYKRHINALNSIYKDASK